MAPSSSSPSPPPSPNPSPDPRSAANPIPDGILTLALPAPNAASARPTPPSSSSAARRIPPPCWTHEDTVALIDSYRDKWYALRRGNLRANHWQEVADAVAVRCPSSAAALAKTAIQCRHKIEKLRKRYRVERQRSLRLDPNSPPASSWIYFHKMDTMELGVLASNPTPAPPRNMFNAATAPLPPADSSSSDNDDSDSEDEDEEDQEEDLGKGRSFQSFTGNGTARGGGLGSGTTGLRFKIPRVSRSNINMPYGEERESKPSTAAYFDSQNGRGFHRGFPSSTSRLPSELEEMRRRLEKRRREKDEEEEGGGMLRELVAALRMLGDGFMRMEQMKIDMTMEFEKMKMEMELKRTEMILESQRRIVDAIVKGLVGRKKAKVSTDLP